MASMDSDTSHLAAVLTGDLVGSTNAGKVAIDETMDEISATAQLIDRHGSFRFTRFRGDGWQMVIVPYQRALRSAVMILAALRAKRDLLPTRIAIGVGRIEGLGTEDLRDASGPAFTYSGQALDNMSRGERLFHTFHGAQMPAQIASILIDDRIRRWTPEQAEAAAIYLDPCQPTSSKVARLLGISPQAASYRLIGAGAGALREALTQLETLETGTPTP